MHALDLRTIISLTGVMGALMALVLLHVRRSYPASFQGLGEWAAGPVLFFLSTLLFGARGLLPDWASMVAANLLLFGGALLLLSGSARFYGHPIPARWIALILLLSSLPLMWWGVWQPDYNSRLMFISSVMAAIEGRHAWVVWRHDRQSYAGRFMLAVLIALVFVMLMRLVTAWVDPTNTDLFAPTLIQTIYIGSFSFGMLLLAIGLVLRVTERMTDKLQHLVTHDMLTGTLSRRALFEQGDVEIERGRRNGTPLSALMLDLDHFKRVNDAHGHLVGDRVLRDFAVRTQALLRRPDHLGRFGGEEFVVLLPETGPQQALGVAQRILDSRTTDPALPICTVSIGVATRTDDEPLDALIERADAALYRAKANGRNRIESAPHARPA
jgi:diguanylate cyclase (GGDEF)-like protein